MAYFKKVNIGSKKIAKNRDVENGLTKLFLLRINFVTLHYKRILYFGFVVKAFKIYTEF